MSDALEFLQCVYKEVGYCIEVRMKAAEIAIDYEIERCAGCGELIDDDEVVEQFSINENDWREHMKKTAKN